MTVTTHQESKGEMSAQDAQFIDDVCKNVVIYFKIQCQIFDQKDNERQHCYAFLKLRLTKPSGVHPRYNVDLAIFPIERLSMSTVISAYV